MSDTGQEKPKKPSEFSEALSQLEAAIANTEALLGLNQDVVEGSEAVTKHNDVPSRLAQLVGWLGDAARRAEVIAEVVAKLKYIVG